MNYLQSSCSVLPRIPGVLVGSQQQSFAKQGRNGTENQPHPSMKGCCVHTVVKLGRLSRTRAPRTDTPKQNKYSTPNDQSQHNHQGTLVHFIGIGSINCNCMLMPKRDVDPPGSRKETNLDKRYKSGHGVWCTMLAQLDARDLIWQQGSAEDPKSTGTNANHHCMCSVRCCCRINPPGGHACENVCFSRAPMN